MVNSLFSVKLINKKLHVNISTLKRLIYRIRGAKVGTYKYIYIAWNDKWRTNEE